MDAAYLVKIIYSLLFPPALLWLMLVGLTVYTFFNSKRGLSYLLMFISIMYYLSSISFVGAMLTKQIDKQLTYPDEISGDVIVMLGEGAIMDARSVDDQGELKSATALNVLVTMKLYQKLKVPIILSGGKGLGVGWAGNEADISKRYLMAMNIPEKMIILDNKSRTTLENARESKVIMQRNGFKKPLLVASSWHIPRAVELFKQQGVQVTPLPTLYQPPVKHHWTLFDFIPSGLGFNSVQAGLKELLGKFQANIM
ncbi:YdcF family protein [Paenibacillus swuensis]|uniref:YdcF family protein n=1 Tax=Paenibacillus swuensis TaxID=1178515 RepID=UPI0008384F9A|nr:YdcF family protein [Paenibacillus swuensis]